MNHKKCFVALGDLTADLYYSGNKIIGIDGGGSRFNVIANLATMGYKTAIVGGCGNDKIGYKILKRYEQMGTNISNVIIRNNPTKVLHLIIQEDQLPQISYKCSKVSPIDRTSTWYEDNSSDIDKFKNCINDDDAIILDKLDGFSIDIIQDLKNDKILDIGNSNRLHNLSDEQINQLKNKMEIIQLNDRVVSYLMKRYKFNDSLEIYDLLKPKLMIITKNRDGAEFIYDGEKYIRSLDKIEEEVDATGAGDAFLSVFAKEYYENNKKIDHDLIEKTFVKASGLSAVVVKNIGARGHIYERLKNKSLKKEREDLERD